MITAMTIENVIDTDGSVIEVVVSASDIHTTFDELSCAEMEKLTTSSFFRYACWYLADMYDYNTDRATTSIHNVKYDN